MSQSDEQGAVSEFLDEIEPTIFVFGAVLTLIFVVAFVLNPSGSYDYVLGIKNWIQQYFNWFFLLVMLAFVLFLAFLIFGPWGKLRLGDEEPEYSYLSYFAMMYSAGLAAGIVFWGPAESLSHFAEVPPLYDAPPKSAAAMPIAVEYAIFHWSLTQWSCFTVMGLAIGYFVYNYDAPLRVSAVLTPILGADNVDGYIGKTVDILAVFATLGGVATSLGFVGSQFITGLDFRWGIALGDVGTILIITGMTVIFTASLILGVNKGIRWLSNFNMVLFFLVMVATLIFGPTLRILDLGTQAFGRFVTDFFRMSLYTQASQPPSWDRWVNQWTVFYWLWPLAWSPFAGLFIARISRGRSVREVAFAGIGATSMATVPWFIIVGGSAVIFQNSGVAHMLGPVDKFGPSVSGFVLFNAIPTIGPLLLVAFLILVTTFFVTSADSSTLAVSMITTGGKEHPSSINRIFWAVAQGAVASILMVVGGVEALQSAAIITGAPFAIVCLLAMLGLIKTFQKESGGVLLQDRTKLIGAPTTREETTDTPGVAGQDDD
ncbi:MULTISPECIES: BCCT family transporter [unclassified Haladaptatus]|uniref:BCCT family transporter n=1 Tax=unclassified Haladaptatus TaxID=2622732 RepID=UPI00209C4D09|nr:MULTISPECIES: BCCT family transporter [unclassified Haladaptatus]MCO8245685.1 BCCT family transporter [Haladaptatus sp. AB643]MCO8255513.1 BCCT family transporter [Haladaptatus sp. AB618]